MPEFHHKRTALIDGDIIAYKAAILAGDDGDFDDVHELVHGILQDWIWRSRCEDAIILLTDRSKPNFRSEIFPEYKAHRDNSKKPAWLEGAYDLLRDLEYRSSQRPGFEADDLLGIMATNGKVENPVIVTIDKDLRCVPGWHCNPDKEDFPVYQSERAAYYHFCYQWMVGDKTDNYGGLPKVGDVKARRLLDEAIPTPSGYVIATMQEYQSREQTWEYCLQQAQVAKILTNQEWNGETKAPIPWTPEITPGWDLTDQGWLDKSLELEEWGPQT